MESFENVKPYLYKLPGELVAGDKIKIHGFIPEDADRATVNLQCDSLTGGEPAEDSKIALHFDIRCDTSIVRNNFDGGWDEEEVDDHEISGGQKCEIDININDDSYEIYLNGIKFVYEHRLNKSDVKYIYVHHDITVDSVKLNDQQLTQVD